MQLTGDRGELMVGFQCAAKIARWNLIQPIQQEQLNRQMAATLTARVEWADEFWAAHSITKLRLWMGDKQGEKGSWWTWDRVHIRGPIVTGMGIEGKVEGNPTATI